jgi:hypothetical protein
MDTLLKGSQILGVAAICVICSGCFEAKVGVGPFKAISVEAGPGGIEAKGPSAGPFKTKSIEVESRDKKDD